MKLKNIDVSEEIIKIPSYPEPEPEKLPMYPENRAHQRTSGRVYPSPIVNSLIRDRKFAKEYHAVILENDFIHLIILPELGGRIFGAMDKTNSYDFFYRQHVIKPALIGIFGSWISGGAEFNWPIHHRPSTFMPADYSIEQAADGSITVWLSEHEPLYRMKGMVGICLYPGKSLLETKTRLYNRTPQPQSFLWWENIAVPVNRDYQIFFPQDVTYVYYHYKKSVTHYPVADTVYNGIDFREGVDLRWHRNPKMATSFFCGKSGYDFFGGYDHAQKAGVVHIANHHISPGKKLFTWAHSQLAESWEKALTDTDGQYAELMAGVYTDNQPDFTWLEPYETKSFSQYWYPLKELGEPKNANCQAALNFELNNGKLKIYLNVTGPFEQASLQIFDNDQLLTEEIVNLMPGEPLTVERNIPAVLMETDLCLKLIDRNGQAIIGYRQPQRQTVEIPEPTQPVSSPFELKTAEELYRAGLHIEQYHDPCIKPEIYWEEAIGKEPNHASSHTALGRIYLKKGRFDAAAAHLWKAIAALTTWNPNPRDGEPYYHLGQTLKYQGRLDEAYDAFYKAIWNFQWRSPGYYSLAEIDCIKKDYCAAREHLLKALETDVQNLKARDLLGAVERKLNHAVAARNIVEETLTIDPLDYWAQNELDLLSANEGENLRPIFAKMKSNPVQTCLDIAYDYLNAGLLEEASDLITRFIIFANQEDAQYPMVYYTLGYIADALGKVDEGKTYYRKARKMKPDYCFPSRLEELIVLQSAAQNETNDPKAPFYLGNLLYDKEQYEAAIKMWEASLNLDQSNYVTWRNLGMAYFNAYRQADKAVTYLQAALKLKPGNPQLVYELNHVMQLAGVEAEERLKLLEASPEALKRDDIYTELVKVHNQLGQETKALRLLAGHVFVPCEGGEHNIVEQYIYANYALGRKALRRNQIREALAYFKEAQVLPENLGAGIWHEGMNVPAKYYQGVCYSLLGEADTAARVFAEIDHMVVDYFSDMYQPALAYYRALAQMKLDHSAESARALLKEFLGKCLAGKEQKDYGYFKATPFFISYLEQPNVVRKRYYNYLIGLAYLGLEEYQKAKDAFDEVIASDRYNLAANLELALISN